jgi:D-alanyl-D-alanine carboxypeptidase (penicillin-binding protein 5/6)
MHTRVYTSGTSVRPPKHRASWRQRFSVFGLLAAALYVVATSWLIPAHAVAGITAVNAYPQTSTKISLAWPSYGQAAVGAVDFGLLASHQTDHPLATASVIKIVTALSVLDKHPLKPGESGPTITMTQQDADSFQWYLAHHGSVIPIRAGQKLSERQALEALLLRSANNMADTLARWAFGSHDNYQAFASNYVRQLGMSQTHIGNDASGYDPSSKSTASDLVKLGIQAMSNPALAEIVGQKSAVIPEVGTINSTNNLLGVRGIIGIKTGNNAEDMGAYLFASDYTTRAGKQVRIIGAVMGASNITEAKQDALSLLVSAEKNFVTRQLFQAGQSVGSFRPAWSSETVQAQVKNDVEAFGWLGTPLHLNIQLATISAPAQAGDQVGIITVGTNTQRKTVGKIVLAKSIDSPNLWWRLTHPFHGRQVQQQDS